MITHTVYNAATGAKVLDEASEAEFDRWYYGHAEYRKVSDIAEVNPAFRDQYEESMNRHDVHWLVQD